MNNHSTSLSTNLTKEEKEEIFKSYFAPFEPEKSTDIEQRKDKDKEKYFETSESDESDTPHSPEEIVEKTSDNSFGKSDEILGSGRYKKVYRGYDLNEGKAVAWNEIQVGDSDTESLEKIIEEVNIMKKLNHPNIVKYLTGWLDSNKGKVVIITELVLGGSLRQNLKRIGAPRLRLVKKWVKEILTALEYLHSMKIIHRDIKCDNIFLDKFSGNVKIGDLGASAVLCKNYMTGYVGTEEFMAPEVYEGKYSLKADIYSLGMSIIEMLTMEKPYKECDGSLNIYDHIVKGIYPESLNKIKNNNIVEFIKLCLRRENERPSAEELIQNPFLNDLSSEENDIPVEINNSLRLKNFYKPNSELNLFPFNAKIRTKVGSINSSLNLKDNEYFLVSQLGNKGLTNSSTPSSPKKESLSMQNVSQKCISNTKCNGNSPNLINKHLEKEKTKKKKVSSLKITTAEVKTNQNLKEENSVEIQFIVGKEEWKNKKLLKCLYNFNKDTVEELVSELQKVINLSDEDSQLFIEKLNESLAKYTNSPNFSQRNTMSSISEQSKQKTKMEEFNQQFSSFESQVKELLQCKQVKNLQAINNFKSTLNFRREIINILESFKKKEKSLNKIMSNSPFINCI